MTRFAADLKKYVYFSAYAARVDLKNEVANSYLNWIWWVLEPLASMAVYYFIFGGILGRGVDHYVLFVYSSALMWSFFNRCMLFNVQAVRLNKDIVNKVYLPKYIFIISNLLFNGFKMLISVGILAVLLAVFRIRVTAAVLYYAAMWLVLILLTFALGTIALHFGVFVDDLSHALGIFMNIFFYLSGVFFDLTTVLPGSWGNVIVRLNPIALVIAAQRNALLYGRVLFVPEVLCWTAAGIVMAVFGVRWIYRYENSYVKVI